METLKEQWASVWPASDWGVDPRLDTGLLEARTMPLPNPHAVTKWISKKQPGLVHLFQFFSSLLLGRHHAKCFTSVTSLRTHRLCNAGVVLPNSWTRPKARSVYCICMRHTTTHRGARIQTCAPLLTSEPLSSSLQREGLKRTEPKFIFIYLHFCIILFSFSFSL